MSCKTKCCVGCARTLGIQRLDAKAVAGVPAQAFNGNPEEQKVLFDYVASIRAGYQAVYNNTINDLVANKYGWMWRAR